VSPVANLTLRSATEADTAFIRELLERSGLPTSDLSTARPEFVIATHNEQIVGIGALERFGDAALFRSVAVEALWRGAGVGRLIVAEIERRAEAAGIDELILLTLTARQFFERLGYHEKEREQISPPVLDSSEFRSLCPISAACMTKNLAPN